MPELIGFRQSNHVSASLGSTPRHTSPDSSNARADRSYSDPPIFRNVIAPEQQPRATLPDPRTLHRLFKNGLAVPTKGDQAQEDGTLADAFESTRSSFTLAVKACQKRRSDSLQKISDCHRPVSLDLNNNVTTCSSRLGVINNTSIMKHCSGALTSPVTPNYRHTSGGLQKGWSSERVPLPQNGNRRQVGGAHFSFNHGGTLPSKWEDAERWIFGPVTTDPDFQLSVPPPQRRPRSKSGPLGPSGVSYYSSHSPAVHMFDGIHGDSLLAGSPFSAGIMAGDSLPTDYGCNLDCPANSESGSVIIHGCTTELLNHFTMPHSPRMGEEHDDVKDAATDISHTVSRRDMATQMSPEGSPCSSSRTKHSISSALSTVEMRSNNSPRLDVRDVEVDERVTVTRWSRKYKSHLSGRGTENADDWVIKTATTHSTALEVSESAKSISKVRKEEARIAAWENLQKAKAEAALKKLELKLEKKRSSSMDKIMNKLRLAQKKGQEMRRAVLANQAQEVSNSSNRTISLRPTRPMSSLSGCFTCHAF